MVHRADTLPLVPLLLPGLWERRWWSALTQVVLTPNRGQQGRLQPLLVGAIMPGQKSLDCG